MTCVGEKLRQIDAILSFVQDVTFFTELPRTQQRALCKVMSMEVFKTKEKVFDLGDHGDKYYIILTGAVIVQTPAIVSPSPLWKNQPAKSAEGELETIAQLQEGQGFGDRPSAIAL
eukprot:s1121_g6.t1